MFVNPEFKNVVSRNGLSYELHRTFNKKSDARHKAKTLKHLNSINKYLIIKNQVNGRVRYALYIH